MGWCRLPVLLCFYGLFLRISSERAFAIHIINLHIYTQYIYIHTYIDECRSKTRGRERRKNGEKEKLVERRRGISAVTCANTDYSSLPSIPCPPRVEEIPQTHRRGRGGSVGWLRVHKTDLKTILIYMPFSHKHIYTSTSQSRDHVIMSELEMHFAWSTNVHVVLLLTPHWLSLVDPGSQNHATRVLSFQVSTVRKSFQVLLSTAFPHLFLLQFLWQLPSRVRFYSHAYIKSLFLYLSVSYFLSLR